MKEICGDVSKENNLSMSEKTWYFIYNLGRGLFGHLTWLSCRRIPFPKPTATRITDSPMRFLLDNAFAELIRRYVPKEELSVFDIGSGSAYYRASLATLGKRGTYTGLDVYRHSRYTDDAVPAFASSLIIKKIEDLVPTQTYDLVMSITALEHILDDQKAVDLSKQLAGPQGVQIHVIPSFLSLFLYLWHGYRQYTPRRVKRLFVGQDYVTFRLGGWGSFLVHFIFITVPERIIGLPSPRRFALYHYALRCGFLFDRLIPVGSIAYIVVTKTSYASTPTKN
jgi:hypothetical protein